jgi:protein associated with RNAse G/E
MIKTKSIDVEMFDSTGRFIKKGTTKVFADIPTIFVSEGEFEKFRKEYKYNEKCIAEEAIYTQKFTKNCNGFPKYYSGTFNRILVNNTTKEFKGVTIGEAWNLGDKID